MEYTVVYGSQERIGALIKAHISEGWVLQGGITFVMEKQGALYFAQAMIKTK